MAKFNTKHKDREKIFKFVSFTDGLNTDVSALLLPTTALSRCRNMKYAVNKSVDGQNVIGLQKRQGTTKITGSVVGSAILATTYYVADAHYIVATASEIYELNSSTFVPDKIGDISGIPTFTEFHGKLIIHDSGVTKAWNGTTFETLNCLYNDEIIETGDGSTVKFAGSFAHPVVRAGATPYFVTIDFTDTTSKQIVDDGNGRLTGNISSTVVKDITAATKAANCEITATSHGFSNGDIVNIQSAGGMTQINNLSFVIANVTTHTFTLGVNSTDYTQYTNGGTASANAIKYTTGAYTFTADGAPDNTTSVYATYEKAGGAPKSKAGVVRASRLYVWGDTDNPSRLWYSGPNDEDGWDTTSSGGYLDVDPQDGYSLTGVGNFFQSLLLVKGYSISRLDNFPGDTTFQVEPLHKDIGSLSYRTISMDAEFLSFLSFQGWLGFSATTSFGDIQRTVNLSERFSKTAVRYANTSAYADYNQQDKQMWIAFHNGTSYLPDIYVVDMTGGLQMSFYQFAFGHTCFKYVNGEMLIGGSDGNLYRLVNNDSTFLDNGVSYASTTSFATAYSDFDLPFSRKHNKRINLSVTAPAGFTCTFNLYKNKQYIPFHTETLTFAKNFGNMYITPDGGHYYIYDMTGYISPPADYLSLSRKFNYETIMAELTDITGTGGVEIRGIEFTGAIIGE